MRSRTEREHVFSEPNSMVEMILIQRRMLARTDMQDRDLRIFTLILGNWIHRIRVLQKAGLFPSDTYQRSMRRYAEDFNLALLDIGSVRGVQQRVVK